MNSKTILAISLATLFAVMMISQQMVAAFVTAPTGVVATGGSATTVNGKTAKLSVTAAGPIPRFPDTYISTNAVVGFGWADLDTGKALITTIHPLIGRDSHQNPNAGMLILQA